MKNPFVPNLRGGVLSPWIVAYVVSSRTRGYLISTFGLLLIQLRPGGWRHNLETLSRRAGMASPQGFVFRV